MHSKDLINLKDEDGYVDITSVMENTKLTYDTPNMKQSFVTEDNVRVFWKPCEPNSFSHFGEVIVSHLSRQFNLPSTKYFFAKYKGVKGTISRDYKKSNETELIGRDFLIDYYKATHSDYKYITKHEDFNNIEFVKEALAYYVSCNKNKSDTKQFSITKEDAESVFEKLLLNYMIDIAVLNPDCHHKNWGLLIDNSLQNVKVRNIPTVDKERSFFLYLPQQKLLSWVKDYYEHPTQENLKKMQTILTDNSKKCTPAFNVLPEGEEYGGLGKNYLESMQELKTMFPNTFEKLLEKFYQLNLSKAFDSVEKETGVKVPKLVKLIAMNAYETRYFEVKEHFGAVKETQEEDKNLSF